MWLAHAIESGDAPGGNRGFFCPSAAVELSCLLSEYLPSASVKKREEKKETTISRGNYLNELEKPGMTKPPLSGEFVLSTLMNFKMVYCILGFNNVASLFFFWL